MKLAIDRVAFGPGKSKTGLFNSCFVRSERTACGVVPCIQVSTSFPHLWEKTLLEGSSQITDPFRTPGAPFGSNHALNHLNVMRAPERKELIVFDHGFGKTKLFVPLFEMGKNF